jgi:hypothetical protein
MTPTCLKGVIFCSVMGLMISATVAVGLSVSTGHPGRKALESNRTVFIVRTEHDDVASLTVWHARWHGKERYLTEAAARSASGAMTDGATNDIDLSAVKHWALNDGIPWLEQATWPSRTETRTVEARGWPFLCTSWWYETWGDDWISKTPRVHGGIRLTDSWNPRILPLRPLWPGVIANTTFFGTAAGIILLATSSARKRLRKARNQCVYCGYSRTGLHLEALCPECGGSSLINMPRCVNANSENGHKAT